jgi:sugar lactone lactonase YvrE
MYQVNTFSHGLFVADRAASADIKTVFEAHPIAELPDLPSAAIAPLPPQNTWVNLRKYGAKGDGITDDTEAIRSAISKYRTIYIPSGRYLVSDTILLKPDTVLIGLHPSTTQFVLADASPLSNGQGAPRALLQTPHGGTNIVTGIGLYCGGINSRAIGSLWMAGKDSLMDDVRFLGGHGTNNADGSRVNPYNNNHTGDPDIHRRWDGQYPSLWVTKGGGGTFANIWTPNTFSQAGMYISDTETPGRVYELSSEHHVRTEVRLNRVANWRLIALQTEEERGEGPFAVPVTIEHSKNILIANYHAYRVISSYQPSSYAIRVDQSENIRFRNFHIYSNSKVCFDASVFDQTDGTEIRYLEVGNLTLTGKAPNSVQKQSEPKRTLGRVVKRLAGGFYNISGSAVDSKGRLYFVDAHWQRIYRWSPTMQRLEVVRESPIDAINLAFDNADDLMLVSYAGDGVVYSFNPDAAEDQITQLMPKSGVPQPGTRIVLPVNYWVGGNEFETMLSSPRPYYFLSPDGTTAVLAREDFVRGTLDWGVKMADLLRAFSLAQATPGKKFYVSNEYSEKTYSGEITPEGHMTNVTLFVERGGESVTTDSKGNVYLAAGQIFVYRPDGSQIGTIDVPERPIDIVFSKDGGTLYILARTSLYSVEIGDL